MMAVQMVTLKPHRYAGKALKPGDEFLCRGVCDQRLLMALGKAAPATLPPTVEEMATSEPAQLKIEESSESSHDDLVSEGVQAVMKNTRRRPRDAAE